MEAPLEITFNATNGTSLAGTVALPKAAGPHPAVLLCQGLSGVRHLVLPEVAAHLAGAGYASLRFDYSGCGDSGGVRGWVDPQQRVRDAMSALAILAARTDVDASRLGVYGHSYGGPVAIHVAAQDERVRALATVSTPGNGREMLRAPRPAWDWLALKQRLDEERAAIAAGQPPTVVGIEEIFPFSPAFAAKYAELKAKDGGTSAIAAGTGLGVSQFYLASVDLMAAFDPQGAARGLTHCPTLLVDGAADDTAPIETVQPVYRAIPGPKSWIILDDADHNSLDTEPGLGKALGHVVGWFNQHLA